MDEAGDKSASMETSREPEDLTRSVPGETCFEMKASEYLEMVGRGGTFSSGGEDSCNEVPKNCSHQKGRGLGSKEQVERPKRKIGRPKGSRTYGVTALRKVNRNVYISDDLMGERCGVNNCSVRLKVCTFF